MFRSQLWFGSACSRRSSFPAATFGFWALLTLATAYKAAAQRNVVVVDPKEIQDVLVNPGMGITTFQRFNGQAPNPPMKWSEAGPVKKLPQAAAKPDFPEASVSYCRWYWNVLEPEPGKFNWELVDLAIEEARGHGQKLAIRLMPYSNEDPLPIARQEQDAQTRIPTKMEKFGNRIFRIRCTSSTGESWLRRPGRDMTGIRIWTPWIFHRWAIGEKAGAHTCPRFPIRRR